MDEPAIDNVTDNKGTLTAYLTLAAPAVTSKWQRSEREFWIVSTPETPNMVSGVQVGRLTERQNFHVHLWLQVIRYKDCHNRWMSAVTTSKMTSCRAVQKICRAVRKRSNVQFINDLKALFFPKKNISLLFPFDSKFSFAAANLASSFVGWQVWQKQPAATKKPREKTMVSYFFFPALPSEHGA